MALPESEQHLAAHFQKGLDLLALTRPDGSPEYSQEELAAALMPILRRYTAEPTEGVAEWGVRHEDGHVGQPPGQVRVYASQGEAQRIARLCANRGRICQVVTREISPWRPVQVGLPL